MSARWDTDRPSGGHDAGEVIFEIIRLGDVQRVAAIHVATGREAIVQAPAAATLADVRALALRKLEHMLRGELPAAPPPRPGKLV